MCANFAGAPWILRCSMDVHGSHMKEWAEILAKVEQMVKQIPISERGSIASFNGNSLEGLAKNCAGLHNEKITYLPSRQRGDDGHLIRLRKNKPEVFRKVITGEMTMVEARRAAGMAVAKNTNVGRAQSAFRMMTKKARKEFLDWLRTEGFLET